MRPVILIDAMNLVFRSHYAHLDLSTDEGYPTGAIYGFFSALLSLQKHFAHNCDLVVCWEGDTQIGETAALGTSWRKELARPMYKSNRVPNAETFRAAQQIPQIVEILKILGVPSVSVPQLEADDVIGVACASLADGEIWIFSNDQDFYQCLDGSRVRVIRPYKGSLTVYNERSLKNEYGLVPNQWSRFKALAGDSSDNYKALPGVGPKGAAKYLKAGVDPSVPQFSNLPLPIRTAFPDLEVHWENLYLCYRLAQIPNHWNCPEFPSASRILLRDALARLVATKRQRQMSREEIKQNSWNLTKVFGGLAMVEFLAARHNFFLGVRIHG